MPFLVTVEKCFIGRGYEKKLDYGGRGCEMGVVMRVDLSFSALLFRDYSDVFSSWLLQKAAVALSVNTCLRCGFQVLEMECG